MPASSGGIWRIVKDYKFEWKDEIVIKRWEKQDDQYCSDECKKDSEEADKEKCVNCHQLCHRKELFPWPVKEAENGYEMWCHKCLKETGKIGNKDKPTDDKNEPNYNELHCEGCHKKDDRYWTFTTHFVNFTKKVHWFGTKCPCLEEFKKNNQQTCPQCKKTEYPLMSKGWLLDYYEIKEAFCSSLCHVTYRELSWEQAQRLTQIEMAPPELEISNSNNQTNFNWEQEGLRREVLFWREYARSLEQRLNNQSNLTPQERQQSNYLRNLQRNTLQRAEDNYRSRYGNLTENSSDNKDKGTNWTPWIIGGSIIGGIVVVGVIALLVRKAKIKK